MCRSCRTIVGGGAEINLFGYHAIEHSRSRGRRRADGVEYAIEQAQSRGRRRADGVEYAIEQAP